MASSRSHLTQASILTSVFKHNLCELRSLELGEFVKLKSVGIRGMSSMILFVRGYYYYLVDLQEYVTNRIKDHNYYFCFKGLHNSVGCMP